MIHVCDNPFCEICGPHPSIKTMIEWQKKCHAVTVQTLEKQLKEKQDRILDLELQVEQLQSEPIRKLYVDLKKRVDRARDVLRGAEYGDA